MNRGHHPPLVLRGGQWVTTLAAEPDPPMGFRLGPRTGLLDYQLQPGDRLIFYTDGIIEAQSPDRELFDPGHPEAPARQAPGRRHRTRGGVAEPDPGAARVLKPHCPGRPPALAAPDGRHGEPTGTKPEPAR
ncbi:SpoIIE family protein phosphatase [Nonomuraea sp. KM88]|uniref:SpoIIE family protein phosphatase n=1 Tax=Nonomuraea sp. KM88 TaxID=3457427 RepID=UPI003FCD6C37